LSNIIYTRKRWHPFDTFLAPSLTRGSYGVT